MRGLNGKVAVVAGGAGGIGTAISLRLGEEGASVVVADIDGDAAASIAEQINSGAGPGRAIGIASDISEEDQVADLVARAVKEFGHLDVLHANAADLRPEIVARDSEAVNIPLDVFDRTIHVNLRGHLLAARYAIPALLERGGGSLSFTSSAAAFIGEPERPAYAIAKSGINALVRHIASKWGKDGIRANAVAPGFVLTDKIRANLTDEFHDYALSHTRSQRLGKPSDIGAMVAFLASDDAEWMNGQVISMDGGATLR